VNDLAALAATSFRSVHDAKATPDLDTAAREFESYLLGEFLRLAEASSLYEGPMDGGNAGRLMKSLFHEEVARIVAESGGIGVARMLQHELGPEAGEPDAGTGSDREASR
jgi:Rod binding domain-containing protein